MLDSGSPGYLGTGGDGGGEGRGWIGELGTYLYRDEDIQIIIIDVSVLVNVELLCLVLPDDKRILWQPLKETLWVRALNVEV